ncbi:MAG: aldo/keto reductase [Opitutales bacterium]|nr:aldo/keto reductase [Opitutales bacterium]
MEYRRLGKSGLQVSELSYGSWVTFGNQIDEDLSEKCMHTAYEAGVNFFDNAEAYANGRSEEVMGRILARSGWSRDSFIVSSKVFFGTGGEWPTQRGLSRKHVVEACDAALRRLQVDYLDLYFCHRPDSETPIEETVHAMSHLIDQGKVLYWGTSEWSAEEIQEAMRIADERHLIPPTMEQPQYNLLHRKRVEEEYAPLYDSRTGLGTTIWSPLASGLLTGKYVDGIPEGSRLSHASNEWLKDLMMKDREAWERNQQRIRKLAGLSEELGLPMAHVALAWCLKNPRVSTVIMGASKVSQLESNLKALEAVDRLDDGLMQRIESIFS